jgi:hypothetical protein
MATKVFISWSGDLSRKLGEALRDWLPAALQYVRPYFTPDDIEKGAKWNSEIAKELEGSNIGLICLTRDNTEKPWILFEAGALSKSFDKSRVCTLLFNLDPADLKGPLTIFQSTRFVKNDFKRLVASINTAAGEANLETSVLDSVFEMWWPRLEKQVSEILDSHKENPKEARRSDRDILEEIVNLTRINASRVSRPDISERAMTDLMENLGELLFLVGIERSETAQSILRRIERPLRHICMESGIPELYERYRMRIRDRLLPESDIKEAKAEPGAAGNGQIAASERKRSL